MPLHNAAWEGPWDLKWTMELSIKLIASAGEIVDFWSVTVAIIVAFFNVPITVEHFPTSFTVGLGI